MLRFKIEKKPLRFHVQKVAVVGEGAYERGYDAGYIAGQASVPDLLADRMNNNLTTYTSENVGRVGSYAFWGCTSIESIDLPSCECIDSAAFQNCTSLKSAKFDGCTSMAGTVFRGCRVLESVHFPNLNTTSTYAFADCVNLTSVVFPTLGTLGGALFSGCTSLERAELPAATSIGAMTFQNCTALTVVTITQQGIVCSLAATSAFAGTPIESGTGFIYVPDNLVEQYKTAKNWSTFATQIKPLSELK